MPEFALHRLGKFSETRSERCEYSGEFRLGDYHFLPTTLLLLTLRASTGVRQARMVWQHGQLNGQPLTLQKDSLLSPPRALAGREQLLPSSSVLMEKAARGARDFSRLVGQEAYMHQFADYQYLLHSSRGSLVLVPRPFAFLELLRCERCPHWKSWHSICPYHMIMFSLVTSICIPSICIIFQ